MRRIETSVLIVGGGPVGLAAAAELGRFGIPCLLVEQQPTCPELPKMNHVNVRSMEICRRWGIADKVRNAGWPDDYPMDAVFMTGLNGHEIVRFPFPSHADRVPPSYSPEASQRCPQIWFDPLLAEHVRTLPSCDIRFSHRMTEFQASDDRITATIENLDNGDEFEVLAQYMIAADGPGSQVRQSLGIEREEWGTGLAQAAIVLQTPDLNALHDKAPSAFAYIVGTQGLVGLVNPTDGRTLWRLNVALGDEPFETFDPHEGVKQLTGFDFNYEIASVLPWTIRFTIAERYAQGRVFLAGDAVHTVSPTGGLGMNTGLGDAVDAAWKIAAVLQGWGGPALLASYDAERRPAGRTVLTESARNMARFATIPTEPFIQEDSPEGEAARARVKAALIEAEAEKEWENDGACLGLRYESSPVIISDADSLPPSDPNQYVPIARPGCRAPHARLPDDRSILDLVGTGLTLLVFDEGSSSSSLVETAAELRIPLQVEHIHDPSITELYGSKLSLVRPDGYIAWQGNVAHEPHAILTQITGLY